MGVKRTGRVEITIRSHMTSYSCILYTRTAVLARPVTDYRIDFNAAGRAGGVLQAGPFDEDRAGVGLSGIPADIARATAPSTAGEMREHMAVEMAIEMPGAHGFAPDRTVEGLHSGL